MTLNYHYLKITEFSASVAKVKAFLNVRKAFAAEAENYVIF